MSLQIGEFLDNRYQILSVVGQGAFSVVYRAIDQELSAVVAIKEFNPASATAFGDPEQMLKRFKREAQVMRKLRHPHILEIYDLVSANDTAYIVMPYLPQTLADRIAGLDLAEACRIMIQICAGLAYAHTAHKANSDLPMVVHCDIKPANILFDGDQVKIADFGIAHIVEGGNAGGSLTTTSFAAGTMFYMPPEQLEGKRDDPRIDVYALGALFYRMLSGGRHYVDFDTTDNTLARAKNIVLVSQATPDLDLLRDKHVPEAFMQIIATALSKEPAERYAHAGEMLQVIQAAARALPQEIVFEPTIFGPPVKNKPKRTWQVILGGAALLVALFLAVKALQPPFPPTATPQLTSTYPTTQPPTTSTSPVVLSPSPSMLPSPSPIVIIITATPEVETLPPSSTASFTRSPTESPTPSQVPTRRVTPLTPIATSLPATTPILNAPSAGSSVGTTVALQWQGNLNANQSFVVYLRYVGTSASTLPKEKTSGALQTNEWLVSLPAEQFGEWRWRVRVVQANQIIAESAEIHFWLIPPGGESPISPLATPPPP